MVWYILCKRRNGSKEMEGQETLRDALAVAFRYLRERRKVVEIGEIGKGAVISAAEIKRLFGPAVVALPKHCCSGVDAPSAEHAQGV
jgi:hypothetical protein